MVQAKIAPSLLAGTNIFECLIQVLTHVRRLCQS